MPDKEKCFVSAVVYLSNAEDCIAPFLSTVGDILDANFQNYEIILVNDGGDEAASLAADCLAHGQNGRPSSTHLINMSYHQGINPAMNAGVDLAIGDFVFEFDSPYIDYAPELLMAAYQRLLDGFDIVSVGPDKMPLRSRLFYAVYNRTSHTPSKLRSESFRIVSRRAINRVKMTNQIIPYRKAVYANCSLPMDFISYTPDGRRPKPGPAASSDKYNLALEALILFTDITFKISSGFALAMVLITVCAAAYTLFVFFGHHPVEGWTSMVLILSICFSAMFFLFSIIIKYLSVILNIIFKKRYYSIGSIDKL